MKEKILVIKDIREIEKYKTKEKKLRNSKKHSKEIQYNFKEYLTGYKTIVFECRVPFNAGDFDPPLTEKECDDLFEGKKVRCMKKTPCIMFFADNIIFKKGGSVTCLFAESVKLYGICCFDYLSVSETLVCDKEVECSTLKARIIQAFRLCVRESFECKTLTAYECILKNVYLGEVKAYNSFLDENMLYFADESTIDQNFDYSSIEPD